MSRQLSNSQIVSSVLLKTLLKISKNQKRHRARKRECCQCLDSMTPQMSTLKGSRGFWQSKSKEFQGMVRSSLMQPPTLCMTLSAADQLWMEFLQHALPDMDPPEIAAKSKTELAEVLGTDLNLAVEHFQVRWVTFWDHIVMGEGRPLGTIVDCFWRVEFQERGSPHIHMLLCVENAPDLSTLGEGVIPPEVKTFVDSIVCAQLGSEMNDFDFSEVLHPCMMRAPMHSMEDDVEEVRAGALAQCVQTHRCRKYCKLGGQHANCRFGDPRPLSNESTIQNVFRHGKTKLVVSPARTHSRVHEYNPSVLSFWGANMDAQILIYAYGAAVYTAFYLTKHEENNLAARILYQLSKNTRNRIVK